jgi:hypothetical protein
MDFPGLSDRELWNVTNVLKQDFIKSGVCPQPHKLMVFFDEAANNILHCDTPKGGFCIRTRRVEDVSDHSRQIIEALWDRHRIPVEVVRNDGSCGWFSLSLDEVLDSEIPKAEAVMSFRYEGENLLG